MTKVKYELDLLMFALINCNKNYKQITKEGKPKVKQQWTQLKNVTPKKVEFKKLEFNSEEKQ